MIYIYYERENIARERERFRDIERHKERETELKKQSVSGFILQKKISSPCNPMWGGTFSNEIFKKAFPF